MEPMYVNRSGGMEIRGVSAQIVGSELERLRELHGGQLTAEQVLDAAEHEASPLHQAFTWNDTQAAAAYRLWQARQLIKQVSFVFEKDKQRTIIPSFLNVPVVKNEARHYQSTTVALASEDQWTAALKELRTRAQSILNTIQKLTALAADRNNSDKMNEAAQYFSKGMGVVEAMIPQNENRPSA